MALFVSQNCFGICWKHCVTSINGYFLVTVSEMDVYIVFIYTYIYIYFLGNFFLGLTVGFFFKLPFANDFFSSLLLSFSLLKKFIFIICCQLACKRDFISSMKKAFHYSYNEHRILHNDQISSTSVSVT